MGTGGNGGPVGIVEDARGLALAPVSDRSTDLESIVEEIFERHDPLALITDDPDVEEEYGPEIATILARLPSAESEGDARRIVHEVLAEWFEGVDVGPESKYDAMASELWAAWQTSRAGRT